MWSRVGRFLADGLFAHLAQLTTVGAGGVVALAMAWAAHATDELKPYAPLSWVLAALIGAMIFSVFYWLVCKGRDLWISATVNRIFHYANPERVNPLQDMFQRQRIDINDLVGPFDRVVKNKTFIDCDIIGPASIGLKANKPGSGSISGASLFQCAGILTKNDAFVPFGILLEDCTFVRGRMYGLLLFVPEAGYQYMIANMPGLPWVTPEFRIPPINQPITPRQEPDPANTPAET